MSKKIYLFLFLIKINFLYSYIVLPIEILPVTDYISKETNAITKRMSHGLKTPFLVKLNIGAKSQTIPLILKPRLNHFLFTSSKPLLNATINYTNKIFYNFSITYSILYNETSQLIGSCQKYVKNKTNPIAEQICSSNETMVFYSDINFKTNKSYSGINFNLGRNSIDNINGLVGLNIFDENNKNSTSFLSILKSKGIINNYNWYLDFADYNNGKLIIGALPHEINGTNCSKNHIVYANSNPNASSNFLEMKFDKIYFKNISNNNSNVYFYNETVEFVFDSNYIEGTTQFSNYISLVLDKFIKAKTCHKRTFTGFDDEFQGLTSKYNFYTCTKANVTIAQLVQIIPSLFFYSSEMDTTFEITPDRLLKTIGSYIYINITFNQANKWKIGKPFLSEYKLAFNPGERKIIYYNKFKNITNNTGNNDTDIIIDNNITENNSSDNIEDYTNNSKDKVYKLMIMVPLIIYLCAGPIILAFKQIMKKNDEESSDEYKNIDNKKNNEKDNKIGILLAEDNNSNENNKVDKNNEEKNIIN